MADADAIVELAGKITAAIFKARDQIKQEGKTMLAGDVTAAICGVLTDYRVTPRAKKTGAEKPKPGTRPVDDETWLAGLQKSDAYRGIDIRRELSKCATWCSVNRKTLSRPRFINWLNKVEAPIQPGGPRGAVRSIYVEPADWRSALQRVADGMNMAPEMRADFAARAWADLPLSLRDLILKA